MSDKPVQRLRLSNNTEFHVSSPSWCCGHVVNPVVSKKWSESVHQSVSCSSTLSEVITSTELRSSAKGIGFLFATASILKRSQCWKPVPGALGLPPPSVNFT